MHRRAERLAERFNQASTQRMAKGNERGAPTEPLFHYTSVAALAAIIVSETFWFTSVYHMDDDQELLFGFGMATNRSVCASGAAFSANNTRGIQGERKTHTQQRAVPDFFEQRLHGAPPSPDAMEDGAAPSVDLASWGGPGGQGAWNGNPAGPTINPSRTKAVSVP
ncbi:hypothetical protein [Bradyrhizobium sp. McL0615]|uniref:hypothetical protein n=1 Tax=Bradyrhizobium sp. McL0615 TaxID=3415673 RepID=UPI003CFB92D8